MISTTLKGADPHEYDHSHPDLAGGWLRASVFGAMDGLAVSYTHLTLPTICSV